MAGDLRRRCAACSCARRGHVTPSRTQDPWVHHSELDAGPPRLRGTQRSAVARGIHAKFAAGGVTGTLPHQIHQGGETRVEREQRIRPVHRNEPERNHRADEAEPREKRAVEEPGDDRDGADHAGERRYGAP